MAVSRYEAVMSFEEPDIAGDIVSLEGLDLSRAKLGNLPVLIDHNASTEWLIGQWENVHVSGKKLVGTMAISDSSETGRKALLAIEDKVLKGVSIRFKYSERRLLADDERGWLFTKTELMEASLVSIPASKRSMITSKKSVSESEDATYDDNKKIADLEGRYVCKNFTIKDLNSMEKDEGTVEKTAKASDGSVIEDQISKIHEGHATEVKEYQDEIKKHVDVNKTQAKTIKDMQADADTYKQETVSKMDEVERKYELEKNLSADFASKMELTEIKYRLKFALSNSRRDGYNRQDGTLLSNEEIDVFTEHYTAMNSVSIYKSATDNKLRACLMGTSTPSSSDCEADIVIKAAERFGMGKPRQGSGLDMKTQLSHEVNGASKREVMEKAALLGIASLTPEYAKLAKEMNCTAYKEDFFKRCNEDKYE